MPFIQNMSASIPIVRNIAIPIYMRTKSLHYKCTHNGELNKSINDAKCAYLEIRWNICSSPTKLKMHGKV